MSSYWEVPVLEGADPGTARATRQFILSDTQPTDDAEPRPRPPLDGEEWSETGWRVKLDVMRSRLIDRLKALRDANEFGVVTVPQGQLQIDERSQGRLARAIKVAETYEAITGQPFTTEWRMFDNSSAPVNLTVLNGWTLLIGAQVQHVFAVYGARFAEIQTANRARLDELEAEIEGGWDVGAL